MYICENNILFIDYILLYQKTLVEVFVCYSSSLSSEFDALRVYRIFMFFKFIRSWYLLAPVDTCKQDEWSHLSG